MTFTMSALHAVEVPKGEPLARVTNGDGLVIYPAGLGKGPMMHMSIADWEEIRKAVAFAILARRNQLADYAACEGNGEGL